MSLIDTTQSVVVIVLIVVCIGLVGSLIWMSLAMFKYVRLKQEKLAKELEYDRLEKENKAKMVEYSNMLLELIRNMVGQIAVLKCRTFQDSNPDMKLVTEAQVISLARDVAETANRSINDENFSFEVTLFTKEFYEEYIVQTSIILVKKLVTNAVDDIVDFGLPILPER